MEKFTLFLVVFLGCAFLSSCQVAGNRTLLQFINQLSNSEHSRRVNLRHVVQINGIRYRLDCFPFCARYGSDLSYVLDCNKMTLLFIQFCVVCRVEIGCSYNLGYL